MQRHRFLGYLAFLLLAAGPLAAPAAPQRASHDGDRFQGGAPVPAHMPQTHGKGLPAPVPPSHGGAHFGHASGSMNVADRDHDHGFHGDDHWHHDWGHGDIHHFYVRDWDAWHQGYWHRGWYGSRFGWWWVVSGVWFFYGVPVYPYPNPYVPYGFVAPPPPPSAAPQPTDAFWYFCPAANGYYPYVPTCPSGWQQVPAQPQGEVQGPPGG